MSSIVKVDTIQENTSANGITVDGLNIKVAPLMAAKDYQAALTTLAEIKKPIDEFFDKVMVMADDEKIKINQILGVITSLIGVLIIITKFQLNTLLSLNLNKGDLWILVAMISWATYSVMVKEKKINLDPLALLQTLIFIGLIFLIPFYLYELHNAQFLKLNIPVLLTVGYVVIFAGIGAYIFWIGAIKIIGPSRSGVFLHLMPVFSSLMAIFLLGERFANFHIFGALFILTGIIVSTKFK